MPRYIPMCFLLSLALGGCAEAGGALATLAVQGITTLGQGVTRNAERLLTLPVISPTFLRRLMEYAARAGYLPAERFRPASALP